MKITVLAACAIAGAANAAVAAAAVCINARRYKLIDFLPPLPVTASADYAAVEGTIAHARQAKRIFLHSIREHHGADA
jgi:hypothetical protein